MSRWKSPATASRRAARQKPQMRHEVAFWLFAAVGVLVIIVCLLLYSRGYLPHGHGTANGEGSDVIRIEKR